MIQFKCNVKRTVVRPRGFLIVFCVLDFLNEVLAKKVKKFAMILVASSMLYITL